MIEFRKFFSSSERDFLAILSFGLVGQPDEGRPARPPSMHSLVHTPNNRFIITSGLTSGTVR